MTQPQHSVIFKPFDEQSFHATKEDWEAVAASSDAFPSDVAQTLKWASEHLTIDGNELAYGVFDDDSKIASGICEVIISRPAAQSWVKLLRLRLHPKVEEQLFNNDPDGVKTALNAYVSAGQRHPKRLCNQPRRLYWRLMRTQLIAADPGPAGRLVDADAHAHFFL
nr:hypothetical protein [Xenophilus sp. Marseille-Q4582]